MLFFFNSSTFSYNDFQGDTFEQDGRRQRCKSRKKEKRAQDLMRIRERRNHLNTAVNEDNSDNSILEDPINAVEEREAPSERHSPAFKVGEIVSIKGDTTERGYSSLFIYAP